MMVATVVMGIFNFLYQILMNRGLGAEDFADFYALLGLFVILSVPGMTIQTVVTKRISQLRAKNDYAGMAKREYLSWEFSLFFCSFWPAVT